MQDLAWAQLKDSYIEALGLIGLVTLRSCGNTINQMASGK